MFKEIALAASLAVIGSGLEPSTNHSGIRSSPVHRAPQHDAGGVEVVPGCVSTHLNDMTLRQQVGQLFIGAVDADHPTPGQLENVTSLHLGGVILTGGSDAGVSATKKVSDRVQDSADSAGVPVWVSADQEGGKVQHLKGPGFESMPTALTQGTHSPDALRGEARRWGNQLNSAGINLNLAPVLDTVPRELGKDNKPIGYYDRQYGYTPATVASHGTAFQSGMTDAGVMPSVKHFPGLGRVLENTDTSRDVTDDVTTRGDAYLRPFQSAIDKGAPVVMVSTARYTQIDPDHKAAFSRTVLTEMLRGDLGFSGVIVSDDLGAAAAVEEIPVRERALRFLSAGGTVVLTVDPQSLADMVEAVVSEALSDDEFRARVHDDARRVLDAKSAAGLLSCW